MPSTTRAVIDIGTNSVKLLIAQVKGAVVEPLFEGSEQTRLGKGFFKKKELQAEAIHDTAAVVTRFAEKARAWDVASIRVIATSAAREAKNAQELLRAIRRKSGLAVEVISGDEEARLAFQGVTTDLRYHMAPLLVLDIGGGSTEFILGAGSRCDFSRSFELGTVRLLEACRVSETPTSEESSAIERQIGRFLAEEVAPTLAPRLDHLAKPGTLQLVGTGGTCTVLARLSLSMRDFDREAIDHVALSRSQVADLRDKLWGSTLAQRKKMAGLPPNRADVILPGAAIVLGVMDHLHFDTLFISTRGLRYAALLDSNSGPKNPAPKPSDPNSPARVASGPLVNSFSELSATDRPARHSCPQPESR